MCTDVFNYKNRWENMVFFMKLPIIPKSVFFVNHDRNKRIKRYGLALDPYY